MNGLRILVIDDEPQLRRSVRRILEGAGYEVESHPSAEWAIDQIKAFGCDYAAVVCDFLLPGMNGVAFTLQLAAMCPELPVLLISGMGLDLPEEVPRLAKPFKPDDLLAAIDALVAEKRITDRAPGGPDDGS